MMSIGMLGGFVDRGKLHKAFKDSKQCCCVQDDTTANGLKRVVEQLVGFVDWCKLHKVFKDSKQCYCVQDDTMANGLKREVGQLVSFVGRGKLHEAFKDSKKCCCVQDDTTANGLKRVVEQLVGFVDRSKLHKAFKDSKKCCCGQDDTTANGLKRFVGQLVGFVDRSKLHKAFKDSKQCCCGQDDTTANGLKRVVGHDVGSQLPWENCDRLGMSARPPNLPVLPLRQDVLLSTTLFEEIENGLSEEFLQEYTGVQDLNEVTFLDLQVDAVGVGERVECLGELLPRLQQLRLSRSHICTIRDLGTSLLNLKVLWLCRCSLQDLGGITVLPVLEELYVSFNDVSDLSPLLSHEALQILDMEGNLVDDFEEIQSLEVVSTLRELDISLNPVRKQEAVTRERILEALPHLEVLDTIPRKGQRHSSSVLQFHPRSLDSNNTDHLPVLLQIESSSSDSMVLGSVDLVFCHDASLLPAFARLLGPIDTWRLRATASIAAATLVAMLPRLRCLWQADTASGPALAEVIHQSLGRLEESDLARLVGEKLLLGFAESLAANDLGQTAVTWAADYGLAEVLQLLLSPLCDARSWALDKVESNGWYPLFRAAWNGRAECAKLLLRAAADVEGVAGAGRYSPLMSAARWGHNEVVGLLLAAAAEPARCNRYGEDAWVLAKGQGHGQVLQLMSDAGAHERDLFEEEWRTSNRARRTLGQGWNCYVTVAVVWLIISPALGCLAVARIEAKAQLEVSDAELEPLSEEEAAEAAEAEEDMQRNDELCSVAALLQQVAAETAAPPADDSGDRALQELRRRAKASSAELAAPPAPLSAEKELPSSEISSAVAAFRESLLGTLGSACGNGAFGEPAARSTSKAAAESEEANPKADEPSEQDLVIESVKRAERPGPTSWTSRASTLRSSREASRRAGGFFPSKRAWGSSSGGSTTCASSALASSRSISFSARQVESEASDLTAGEDGLALAGTPLAAIRRRRKGAQERGEEADIRDLLRRFEAGVGQEETSQTACGPAPRPMTSDVRINPRRPLSASSPSSGLRSSPKRQSSKREICDGVLEMSPTSSQSMPKPKAFGSAEVLLISQS
ncbi:Leucine-rich repeat-containing protein 56 [Symbiodinium microadriaticum]|uniref:Leucine-rich repeat-containing protein 56 n=1 Tax=Symbiodinium microadriaticum TaxID=2951 RepID=A0A1Q9D7B7_SYMMI|nr:Leucine-rich repeat-containing protein 56 [Symbiodinium microadriaticum]